MAVPKSVTWPCDPHTAAKHQLLRGYLDAWFPILGSSHPRYGVTFVDAFAGPGEYDGGEIGSPIEVVQAVAAPATRLKPTPFRLLFIEKDKPRFDHLSQLISDVHLPANCELTMYRSPCETVLISALDQVGARRGPVFINLDGWGVDTPFDLVRQLGTLNSAEILVTFNSHWFTRFAKNEIVAGDTFFGDRLWRQVAELDSPSDKKRFLVDEYLGRLKGAGFPLHLTFELVDEGGHQLFLVFGTSNELGIERMKDSMWRVDDVTGSRFRDPRDPNQLEFDLSDTEPDFRLLTEQILELLVNGPQSMLAIQRFTLLETVYKKAHAKRVVDRLENLRMVSCVHTRAYKDYLVTRSAESLF